jgi:hypothetical protein
MLGSGGGPWKKQGAAKHAATRFAKRIAKPRSPTGAGDLYALGGWHGAAASRGVTAAAKYQAKMAQYERWKQCPRCGTGKVKTVSKGDFQPTAATAPDGSSAAGLDARLPAYCSCGVTLSAGWRYRPMVRVPLAAVSHRRPRLWESIVRICRPVRVVTRDPPTTDPKGRIR